MVSFSCLRQHVFVCQNFNRFQLNLCKFWDCFKNRITVFTPLIVDHLSYLMKFSLQPSAQLKPQTIYFIFISLMLWLSSLKGVFFGTEKSFEFFQKFLQNAIFTLLNITWRTCVIKLMHFHISGRYCCVVVAATKCCQY